MAADKIFDVSGKNCIITGGTRGIGLALSKGFLRNGCNVVMMGSNKERLEKEVKNLCDQGYKAYAVCGDLSKNEETIRMFNEGLSLLGGKLDVMIPCAGVQHRDAPEDFPLEEMDRVMHVNFYHVYIMAQRAAQVMMKQETGGKIILIGSLGCHLAGEHISAYSASKGAVLMLGRSFGMDLAKHHVNVNVLSPGWIKTEIWSDFSDEKVKQINAGIPAGRCGEGEDLVGAALFLASSASDYMNGSEVVVDGGLLGKL